MHIYASCSSKMYEYSELVRLTFLGNFCSIQINNSKLF